MGFYLDLILTGHCNLRCSYCYQTAARVGAMPWTAVCAAVDAALSDVPDTLNVVFNGGEPLLVPQLLRNCIDRVRAMTPSTTALRLTVLTNGVFLDPRMLEFFLSRNVHIQLGVHSASNGGGERSVEDLVAGMAESTANEIGQNMSLSMVVTAERIDGLASRVCHLIGLGLSDLYLVPPFTPDPSWTPSHLALLRREIALIVEHSLKVQKATGRIPVEALRPDDSMVSVGDDQPICNAVSGSKFCVDPTGHAWACPCFSTTMMDLPESAHAVSKTFDLGDVRAPGFSRVLARLGDPERRPRPFHRRAGMYSGLGRCAECAYLDECSICPASICHGGSDQGRIPDHICAFSLAMKEGARQMEDRVDGDLNRLLDDLVRSEVG